MENRNDAAAGYMVARDLAFGFREFAYGQQGSLLVAKNSHMEEWVWSRRTPVARAAFNFRIINIQII
jgi:hypothetical protein